MLKDANDSHSASIAKNGSNTGKNHGDREERRGRVRSPALRKTECKNERGDQNRGRTWRRKRRKISVSWGARKERTKPQN